MLKVVLPLCLLPLTFAWGESGAAYFKNTYQESRAAFRDQASSLQKSLRVAEVRTFPIPTHSSQDLSIDTLYIPPASGKKERLLILTSGVHGIEGFVGSALQLQFLHENFWNQKDEDLGILIVHAINPYGFEFARRVSENNVDLNRNFDTDKNLFQLKNEGYQNVSALLNPKTPAQSGFWDRAQFYLKAVVAIAQHSMESLRRAVLRGQYEDPTGIYFGGHDFEPQKEILEKEFLDRGIGYKKILLVDLHTGYGQRGHLHLFADRSRFLDADYLKQIFAGSPLDEGSKKDFYEVTGGMVVFAAKLFHERSRFAGMVFEFGTLDSQKTLGSLDSIYRMSKENQLAQMSAASEKDRNEIQTQFREMFYPSSEEWRQSVVQQFQETLGRALTHQRK